MDTASYVSNSDYLGKQVSILTITAFKTLRGPQSHPHAQQSISTAVHHQHGDPSLARWSIISRAVHQHGNGGLKLRNTGALGTKSHVLTQLFLLFVFTEAD